MSTSLINTMSTSQIDQKQFYEPYHGHNINDIIKIYCAAKSNNIKQIIWLAGDQCLRVKISGNDITL